MFKKNDIIVARNEKSKGYHLLIRVTEDQVHPRDITGTVMFSDDGNGHYHKYEVGHHETTWAAEFFELHEAWDQDALPNLEAALDKLEEKLC